MHARVSPEAAIAGERRGDEGKIYARSWSKKSRVPLPASIPCLHCSL